MAMQDLRRVNTEIQDINNDFHSLRIVIRSSDDKSLWNFVMFPNDGAMSHLPANSSSAQPIPTTLQIFLPKRFDGMSMSTEGV